MPSPQPPPTSAPPSALTPSPAAATQVASNILVSFPLSSGRVNIARVGVSIVGAVSYPVCPFPSTTWSIQGLGETARALVSLALPPPLPRLSVTGRCNIDRAHCQMLHFTSRMMLHAMCLPVEQRGAVHPPTTIVVSSKV